MHTPTFGTLVFSHANSFPASTYQVLFKDLRLRGYTVHAIDKYGHDPRYPVTDNWPHVVQQLVDHARKAVDKEGAPVWLVGHSLGGFLSLMAACLHPELAKGVVLLDSPVLGGWRSSAVRLAKTTQLMGSISPGAVSKRRRKSWPNTEAALAHFQRKDIFAKWSPAVLQDYVNAFTEGTDGKRSLAFDRAIETALYNTLPHHLDRLLARHPLACPVSFIGGLHSVEIKQVGMTITEKVTRGRIMMLDGSHLFPMEKPLATAAALEAALRNMEC